MQAALNALVLVLVAGLAACGKSDPPSPSTTVLGGASSGPQAAASAPLTDSSGRVIPPPPQLPPGVAAQMTRSGPDTALATWVHDAHVVAAAYTPSTGWSAPAPLEDIHGEASRPQLASNGRGAALAVWQHTVGSIQSLRFSRFDGNGWSIPDVMPGALPRPPAARAAAADAAPQLHMDPQGNAFAQWPSGFDAGEVQTARYVAGHGWTRALSEPVTAAAPQPGRAVQ